MVFNYFLVIKMVGKLGMRKATNVMKRKLSFSNSKDVSSNPTPDVESCSEKTTIPLLPENADLRNRKDIPRYVPTDWDDSLPYGGKVYLARQKKPDSWPIIALQALAIVFVVGMVYWVVYHPSHLHFNATKLYAKWGHRDAQAIIGHKLLHGHGVEQNHTEAMSWLHEAAKQGHPEAAYNVAVGHLQGYKTNLEPGDAKKLIQHAADNGVFEAIEVLNKVCSQGKCDI